MIFTIATQSVRLITTAVIIIQELAGHSSLATTQRYIQGDSRAKQNVVRMI